MGLDKAVVVFPDIEDYKEWVEAEGNRGKFEYQEYDGMKVTYGRDFISNFGELYGNI